MKFGFVFPAVLLIAFLVSCAGSPEPEVQQSEPPESVEIQKTERSVPVTWLLEKEVSRYVDGTVDKVSEYSYDEQGRKLAVIEKDARDMLILERVFNYTNGNLSKVELSDRTGPVSTTSYETDNTGRIQRETIRDSDGKVQSELIYSYNGELLDSSVARDAAGNPQLVSEYSYQNGIAVRVEYKRIDGTPEAIFERIVEGGNVVEERTVLPDGSIESAVKFKYEGGRKASASYFIGGTKTKTVVFDTDPNGNVVKETWQNAVGRPYELIERTWIGIQKTGEEE